MNQARNHRKAPTQQDLIIMVPTRKHSGVTLHIPLNRTVLDENLLSWVGGGLSEALIAAREGMRLDGGLRTAQRERLEALVEEAISMLDTLDGDADLEPDLEGDEAEADADGLLKGGSERLAY